jgi:hypothetical protein
VRRCFIGHRASWNKSHGIGIHIRSPPLRSVKRYDLAIRPRYDVRRSGDPLNEAIGHRATEIAGSNDEMHLENARGQKQSTLHG